MKAIPIPVGWLIAKRTFIVNAVNGLFLLAALFAYQVFNYSTTVYALERIPGPLSAFFAAAAGIIAIGFCAIDILGVTFIFVPETKGEDLPMGVWRLYAIWLVAAVLNALLTWWAIRSAVADNALLAVSEGWLNIVPVFVAVMVFVIRVLIVLALNAAAAPAFWPEIDALRRTRTHRTAPAADLPDLPREPADDNA